MIARTRTLEAQTLRLLASMGALACAAVTPGSTGTTPLSGPMADAGATGSEPVGATRPLNAGPEALLEGEVAAVAWSGYRTGQHPDRGDGERPPTDAQILEDLQLMTTHGGFRLIRVYDSGPVTARALALIEGHDVPLKVVLGAWLRAEISTDTTCTWLTAPIPPETLAANRVANAAELDRAIALAKAYPSIVSAVSVGNEALVTWNDHLVATDTLLDYARRVKDAIAQPVTTSDNYVVFREQGPKLATVLDFFMVHTYPVWEGKRLNEAAAYTIENLESIRRVVPSVPIVVGEAGWPSVASEFGERASEAAQTEYLDWLCAWARANNVTTFLFEAFDEDWKGDPTDPAGAEKHWGIYTIDRRPKAVLKERPRRWHGRP